MSSFGGLSIAVSGIFAQQRSLDTTGHNISNVNTPGYSRQIAIHSSSSPVQVGYTSAGTKMSKGTGVDIILITQYRDEFLDAKVRKNNKELGYWEALLTGVEDLEGIFNDYTDEGIQTAMNNFWDAWEQLSKPTGRLTSRALVKESAIALVESIKNTDQLLKDYRADKDKEIMENVDRINEITKRIGELNDLIIKVEANGAVASDFRDERNLLLDELSQLVDLQVVDGKSVTVMIEGRAVVDGKHVEQLKAVPDPSKNGLIKLVWERDNQAVEISGGRIKALFYTRDELVDSFRSRLDEMIKGLAAEVNSIHITGYGVSDDIQRKFFINSGDPTSDYIDMSNIAFNPELNDYDNIAAALNPPPYNYEDNVIALKILEIRDKKVFGDTKYDISQAKYDFDEYYRNIILDLGKVGLEASINVEAHNSVNTELENKRGGIMGVSLDEEMTNLIRFEHSYNASARMVNVMDEMIDIVVNRLGIVGR
ncbi:flagellar hook-associated protein FlgK [Lutispora thermophila]|mgnify:CR=1 FL=1|uniref:Flagellar hook-associated protein 1 n=1 Tax=Lutispora thermophila DSM 19022 TaxID=1122184 RepID=A0A1M6AQH8_9FIRM|nr:flagellar hook-associated protein FlgK [Lutispora thermophila]SHI38578.1 flagellar hook-associated protein 1 FlgK [Lutispora thermophila DSM 19022]